MEDTSYWRGIVLVLLLIMNAILYAFKAAIRELYESNLEKSSQEGSNKAKKILKVIENPTSLIIVIQLLTIGTGILIGMFFLHMFNNVVVTVIGMALTFLIFGQLLPKRIGAKYCNKTAYTWISLVSLLLLLFTPITYSITVIVNLIGRLFGINSKTSIEDVTEAEIISMVNEGHEQGVLQESEAKMITNIFEFGDKQAKDVMIHRKNIIALDGDDTLENVVKIILKEKNSRYPVYEENIDNIIGILHMKDALRQYADESKRVELLKNQSNLIMEARFIPETRNIDILFRNMQSEKIHMVVVVDEYGQTAGLIAMEDILEEIVGNILDEYDEEEEHILENEDNTYSMNGMTTLEEVEEILHIAFDEEECDTLNGFLLSRLGKIPEEGDKFETDYGGYHFEVQEIVNKMIAKVLVTKIDYAKEASEIDHETLHDAEVMKEVEESEK